jgi:hydrogenase maturation protease
MRGHAEARSDEASLGQTDPSVTAQDDRAPYREIGHAHRRAGHLSDDDAPAVWVIGVGNPLRGDDAAGAATARLVAGYVAAHVRVVETSGDGLALLDYCRPERTLFVIDAARATGDRAAAVGSVIRWDGDETPLPRDHWQGSGHLADVGTALALAEALGRLPRRLVVYGIVGACFDLGADLSPAVAAAAAQVAASISAEIAALERM